MRWVGWGPLSRQPRRSRVQRWLVRSCIDRSSGGWHGGCGWHCHRRGRLLHPLLLGCPVVRLRGGGVDPGRPGLVPHAWLLCGCSGMEPALLRVVLGPCLRVLCLLHLLVLPPRLCVGHVDWVAWRGRDRRYTAGLYSALGVHTHALHPPPHTLHTHMNTHTRTHAHTHAHTRTHTHTLHPHTHTLHTHMNTHTRTYTLNTIIQHPACGCACVSI